MDIIGIIKIKYKGEVLTPTAKKKKKRRNTQSKKQQYKYGQLILMSYFVAVIKCTDDSSFKG